MLLNITESLFFRYDTWNVLVPEGQFLTQIGNDNFIDVLIKIRGKDGESAVREWKQLKEDMRPLARAASMTPPVSLRFDLGVFVTALGRYLSDLIACGPTALSLTGPFTRVIEGKVNDPFIRNW